MYPVRYNNYMNNVRETEIFKNWMRTLKDTVGRSIINARIRRLSLGNSGDTKSVGQGVSELRIDFGPGYRVYYILQKHELLILLCGGDKSSQQKDIESAKEIARNLEVTE
jgi:putative addiction module killer protein